MFVKFQEDTGEIIGIGPRKDINCNSIEVDLSEVIAILEGKESRRNYRVQYDPKTKQLDLVNVTEQTFSSSDVNEFIYEVPELELEDPDVYIEQNIPETCWKVHLGKQLKRNLKREGIRLNTSIPFSVTAKHDPNILYKTLFVDFSQIFSDNYYVIDFTMPFEMQDIPVSVFTMRKFDTYQFQRIIDAEN